ncbi:prepilin-type N-terminal cleavage/methylation domain-containing protein [Halodesulfovibrio sp.]|jgi:hypothetical protein|uniref:prepilin-type N-terminal cleavage/methylation domain-containing protein n=1 Tax=Halodesulfovibrio sp. TaxID=1912772 RepID=UPI0025F6DF07|nr:prepilin-type N-terminal cleavage/methylation domain-containing protein [Halodesulfovibrio sp.]MCT4625420.1 prepilin-type N-terminal cleavage/methylation domain-containing protein [Halodesulfovibrio sp.]
MQISTVGKPNSEAGMTLLETVVALVLLVILATVAAPRVWETLRASSLDHDIATCSRFIEKGVDSARRDRKHLRIKVYIRTGKIELVAAEEVLSSIRFSSASILHVQKADKTMKSGTVELVIKPAGIIEEASMVLSDGQETRTVHIQAFRGKTTVHRGAQQNRGK